MIEEYQDERFNTDDFAQIKVSLKELLTVKNVWVNI